LSEHPLPPAVLGGRAVEALGHPTGEGAVERLEQLEADGWGSARSSPPAFRSSNTSRRAPGGPPEIRISSCSQDLKYRSGRCVTPATSSSRWPSALRTLRARSLSG